MEIQRKSPIPSTGVRLQTPISRKLVAQTGWVGLGQQWVPTQWRESAIFVELMFELDRQTCISTFSLFFPLLFSFPLFYLLPVKVHGMQLQNFVQTHPVCHVSIAIGYSSMKRPHQNDFENVMNPILNFKKSTSIFWHRSWDLRYGWSVVGIQDELPRSFIYWKEEHERKTRGESMDAVKDAWHVSALSIGGGIDSYV